MNPPFDPRSRCLRRWRSGAVWLAGLPVAALAMPPDWQAGAATVRDLIQSELPGAAPAPVRAVPQPAPPPTVRLTALYGMRGSLTAIVDVNGVRKEYRPGASLPYGGGGSATEYRLVRIVDTCVVLRRGQHGRLRTACYSPAPPAAVLPAAIAGPSAAVLSAPLPFAEPGVLP